MFDSRGDKHCQDTQQVAQWAPGTGLGVAVLFWNCQCGHLLSGHVEKGISERGIELRCLQTLLCSSTTLPGERGVLRKIPKDWGCSQPSTQEGGKAPWGLLAPSTGWWHFISSARKGSVWISGVQMGVQAPSSGCLCSELQSYRNPWEEVAHLSGWPLPPPQGPQVLPTFQGAVFMECDLSP